MHTASKGTQAKTSCGLPSDGKPAKWCPAFDEGRLSGVERLAAPLVSDTPPGAAWAVWPARGTFEAAEDGDITIAQNEIHLVHVSGASAVQVTPLGRFGAQTRTPVEPDSKYEREPKDEKTR